MVGRGLDQVLKGMDEDTPFFPGAKARPLTYAVVILRPPELSSCVPNPAVVLLCSARKVGGARSEIKK